jgi:hypothetical protein
LILSAGAMAAEPQLVWQAEGLDGLESAVLDPDAGVLYRLITVDRPSS